MHLFGPCFPGAFYSLFSSKIDRIPFRSSSICEIDAFLNSPFLLVSQFAIGTTPSNTMPTQFNGNKTVIGKSLQWLYLFYYYLLCYSYTLIGWTVFIARVNIQFICTFVDLPFSNLSSAINPPIHWHSLHVKWYLCCSVCVCVLMICCGRIKLLQHSFVMAALAWIMNGFSIRF